MKQVMQNLSTGQTELVEAPAPRVRPGSLLIDASISLVSTGTERMLVDFGKASLVSKARQQPEKVKQVLNKVRTDGLMTTIDAVRSKLGQPIPLGYCHVGQVREPKVFVMLMNAGEIPADHWTQDPAVGGGRIVGEACHHIDLMRHLAGSEIVSISARRMGDTDSNAVTEDKAAIILGFADGSFGTIHYLANGASNFPKERIEVFVAGRTLQLDNFLKLKGFGWPGFSKMSLMRQDKGQTDCAAAFLKAVETGGPSPIPMNELLEVARVTLDAADQLRSQT